MLVPSAFRRALTWNHREAEWWTSFCWVVTGLRWARGFGSHAAEAPRWETPCHVKSGTVVSRVATRPCGDNCLRP